MKIALDADALCPQRSYPYDAGLDLKSPVDATIPPRGSTVINTGVHVEIPQGYAGFLKSKSGLNVKHNITSEGVIDAGYTVPIYCKLYNLGDEAYTVQRGDRITQLVILPILLGGYTLVDKIDDGSQRGDGGFGSTGR